MHNNLSVQNNNPESTIAITRCWVSKTVHKHNKSLTCFLLHSLVATEDWTVDCHWTAAAKHRPSRRAKCFLLSGRRLRKRWSPELRRCQSGIWSKDTWIASLGAMVISKMSRRAAKFDLIKLLRKLDEGKLPSRTNSPLGALVSLRRTREGSGLRLVEIFYCFSLLPIRQW